MKKLKITKATPQNLDQVGIFCLKNKRLQGYKDKVEWFQKYYEKGLRLKILTDEDDNQLGFIEYMPIESAWRPISGFNYMFIQCIYIYGKENKSRGLASMLISDCIKDAWEQKMNGVAVFTSEGTWMAAKEVFLKNEFRVIDSKDRFDLLCYRLNENTDYPTIIDWTRNQEGYQGWHLLYSDQCPMNEKAAETLYATALDHNLHLEIKKLETPEEIRHSPSGFGVFSLLHNGRLLADHYISATRFKNILKKEMVT